MHGRKIQSMRKCAIQELCQSVPHLWARCRIESIILQRSVICEFIRDIEWGFTERFSIPEDVSLDLEALLEPLGVAIHASRRAQLHKAFSTLLFWNGAVGLLCAAVAKASGSGSVIIADSRIKINSQNGGEIGGIRCGL